MHERSNLLIADLLIEQEIAKGAAATISAIERGRVNLGIERAKVLATALHVHPALIVFPGWEIFDSTAA